ncbi:MAG: hypothetical protein PHI12_12340 [Dehalococcoidales bacterium]|jgi:hypothetical protein|nr:hypothetical protein [Dehalococcoidales bacterium]
MKNINLGCIVKLLALLAVIAVIGFIFVTCSGTSGCNCQRIDKTLPDVSAAPYRVPTVTHYYYAEKAVTNHDGSVTMTGWYERMNDKWFYHEDSETLPPVLKPRVERR